MGTHSLSSTPTHPRSHYSLPFITPTIGFLKVGPGAMVMRRRTEGSAAAEASVSLTIPSRFSLLLILQLHPPPHLHPECDDGPLIAKPQRGNDSPRAPRAPAWGARGGAVDPLIDGRTAELKGAACITSLRCSYARPNSFFFRWGGQGGWGSRASEELAPKACKGFGRLWKTKRWKAAQYKYFVTRLEQNFSGVCT